jgi:hypothetical protein
VQARLSPFVLVRGAALVAGVSLVASACSGDGNHRVANLAHASGIEQRHGGCPEPLVLRSADWCDRIALGGAAEGSTAAQLSRAHTVARYFGTSTRNA